jgi:caffeoyl-CoA O-methyltransferase
MGRPFTLDARLHDYVVAHTSAPGEALAGLAERTQALGDVARMQVTPEQGAMLTALTRLSAGRFAVEVGTFTGYSSTCIARGLAPGGRLLCCDVSTEWTDMARETWRQAGVDDRIDLVIAPAAETLAGLDDTPVDLAFVDADKPSYGTYLDLLLPKLADRGVIVVDNVLWAGTVADPDAPVDDNLAAIRAFNDHVVGRDDCDVAMLPVGDGVSLITRRQVAR